MYRAPVRPQRSPGAPRPAGRFPSPTSCWGFHGARSPYGGCGHRGGSPRGGPAYSPAYSPGSIRGYRDGSPFSGFNSGSRGFGDSPAGFIGESRGFGGQMWRRGGGFRRPSTQNLQSGPSDSSVEKYFSPSMLQDPWAALQPIANADRQTT
ncbi:M-phase-specific PLK1-interacting protein [Enoplosus armatus]|uniref:M-phase-specific PLK1-interacting protein n=1 Tax=Enoplosus armatus TaxID=215367 RepID=UPI003991A6F6